MRDFDGVSQAFMGAMIRIWRKVLYWLDVTAQLIRHNGTSLTSLVRKRLATLGLNQNIKNIAVRINSPPKPKPLSADRDGKASPSASSLWCVDAE